MMRVVFVAVLMMSCALNSRAQTTDRTLDSLKNELAHASRDTHHVLLLCALGVKYSQTEPALGIEPTTQALELSKKLNYTYGTIKANNLLGRCYAIQNNFPQALKHFYAALGTAQQIENYFMTATIRVSIGAIYTYKKDYDKALEQLTTAREEYKKAGTGNLASLMINIGFLYTAEENYKAALDVYKEGLEMERQRNDITEDFIALHTNLGSTHILLNEYTQGFMYLYKAYDLAETIHNDKNAAYVSQQLGMAYYHTYMDSVTQLTDTLRNQAHTLARAEHFLLRSVALCRKLGIKEVLLLCHEDLAKIYAATGRYKDAYNERIAYSALRDSIQAISNEKAIARVEAEYLFQKSTDSLKYQHEIKDKEVKQGKIERNGAILLIVLAATSGILFINRQKLRHEKKQALVEAENARIRLIATQQLEDFSRNIQDKNELIEKYAAEIEKYQDSSSNNDDPVEHGAFLQLQQSVLLTDEQWEEFKSNFEKVHSGFLARLKEKLPDLTPAEVRFMVLSKLRFTNKEMAAMLGISLQAVRNYKYRLLKKQGLTSEDAIDELIKFIS